MKPGGGFGTAMAVLLGLAFRDGSQRSPTTFGIWMTACSTTCERRRGSTRKVLTDNGCRTCDVARTWTDGVAAAAERTLFPRAQRGYPGLVLTTGVAW
jgi:hypothetical protein